MSTHPYLPLYIDDYEAATTHLTPEEDGVYNRLLRLCWRTPGCSLPNDPAWIARKIRLSAEDFERFGQPVLAEFFRLQRGRLTQRRLKREYDDISRKKSARKLAGKKGGDAKARKTKENEASKVSVLPAHTRAFHTQNQIEPNGSNSEDKSSAQVVELEAVKPPAPDPDRLAWTSAALLLTGAGVSEASARSFFGKLLSENGLRAKDLLTAVAGATAAQTPDPQAYLRKAARAVAKRAEPTVQRRVGYV